MEKTRQLDLEEIKSALCSAIAEKQILELEGKSTSKIQGEIESLRKKKKEIEDSLINMIFG